MTSNPPTELSTPSPTSQPSVPRQTVTTQMTSIWEWLATSGGLGNLPKAPGTYGSLPGLLLGPLIQVCLLSPPGDSHWGPIRFITSHRWIFLAVLILILLGAWIISRVEKMWGTHDDQRIVIDETIGQAVTLAFCTPDYVSILLGFALFRLFDIVKPGPIGWIDRKVPGAWGTLLDDVLAGVAAAIVLTVITSFF